MRRCSSVFDQRRLSLLWQRLPPKGRYRKKCKMNAEHSHILAIPSPFAVGGLIKVLEAPDADPAEIVERLFLGHYEKPFVMDDGYSRMLYFSFAFVQSAMRIRKPNALELAYTQKMMSFALFQPNPRHLLMLGLGGGSLAKFCHAHFPETQITIVEVNPHVIAFRSEFKIPRDSDRFQVVLADAAEYVARSDAAFDVILADAFDKDGFADSLCNREFYCNLNRLLSDSGVLVCNLAGRDEERMAHLGMLDEVFGGRTLAIPVGPNDNHIAIAFADPRFAPQWGKVFECAEALGDTLDLELLRYAKKLKASQVCDFRCR